jgi:hypothetical protein
VALDQRLAELPLRASDLEPVALEGRRASLASPKVLPLDYECSGADGQVVDGSAAPPAAKPGRAQMSKRWAASHVLPIGANATKV